MKISSEKLSSSDSTFNSAANLWALLALAVFCAAFAFGYFRANEIVYDQGHLVRQDDHLLIHEMAKNFLRGDFEIQAQINGNLIGTEDHFSPTYLLLLPFYWVTDRLIILLFILSLIVAFAGTGYFLLARQMGSISYALIVALLYFILPETLGQALSGMWLQTPAWILAPFLMLAYIRENRIGFFICALLLLGTMEEMFLVVAGFGLLALVDRRSIKWIISPIIMAAIWVTVVFHFTDNFGGGRAMSQVATQVIANLFSLNPIKGALVLILHLTPILWLAIAKPRYLIPGAGVFALGLLYLGPETADLMPGSSSAHYFTSSLPFIYAAAVAGIGEAMQREKEKTLSLRIRQAFIAFLIVALFVAFKLGGEKIHAQFLPDETTKNMHVAVDALRPGARVATMLKRSYMFEDEADAVLEFDADMQNERFELNEHFRDWEALRDYKPRLHAYQTQRTKQQLGGVAVMKINSFGSMPEVQRVFAPDPYALALGDLNHDGIVEVVAGTMGNYFLPRVGVFAVDRNGVENVGNVFGKSRISNLAIAGSSDPIIIMEAQGQIWWIDGNSKEMPHGPLSVNFLGAATDKKSGRAMVIGWDQGESALKWITLDQKGTYEVIDTVKMKQAPLAAYCKSQDSLFIFFDDSYVHHLFKKDEVWNMKRLYRITGDVEAISGSPDGTYLGVATSKPNKVYLFNSGKKNDVPTKTLELPARPAALAFGNVDADTKLDVVVGFHAENGIMIFNTETGEGRFIITGPFSTQVKLYDFEGDGLSEVVTPLHNVIYGFDNLVDYFAKHKINTVIIDDPALSKMFSAKGWTLAVWKQHLHMLVLK